MRLQRALARSGVASRRRAEDLIRTGRVRVNGQVASIGMSVDPAVDVITVGRRRVKPQSTVWIALNKPVGYAVTKGDARGRPSVFELLPSIPGLTYVGRLDVMTSGLMVFTTDGHGAHRLAHPRYQVERTYRVIAHGRSAAEVDRRLARPLQIDGRTVGLVRYRIRSAAEGSLDLTLVLAEGRNRIVRRTCELLGLKVDRLVRLSHGPVQLGRLAPGEWRYLSRRELAAIRSTTATSPDE